MDITRELLDATNARTIVRDLYAAHLVGSGLSDDAPALSVPLARLEDDWGVRPSSELRRFAPVFHRGSLPPVQFDVHALPELRPGVNLVERLLELTAGEGPGQAAVFGIFHGALPIGRLVLPDQSLYLFFQLADYGGIKKGRVVATPEVAGGAVVLVEKVLGTFLHRLAADHLAGESRYASSEFEVRRTPSSWLVTSLLSGGSATLGLNRRWFYRLNPALDDDRWRMLAPSLGKDVPTSLYVLFRTYFLDEGEWMSRALDLCLPAKSRLIRDAAALVVQLSEGRSEIGPIRGFTSARERISASVRQGRALTVGIEPAESLLLLETVANHSDAEELFPPAPVPGEPESVAPADSPPSAMLDGESKGIPLTDVQVPLTDVQVPLGAIDGQGPPVPNAPETGGVEDAEDEFSVTDKSTFHTSIRHPVDPSSEGTESPGSGEPAPTDPGRPADVATPPNPTPAEDATARRRVAEHAGAEITGVWFDQAARGVADSPGFGTAADGPLGVSILTWLIVGGVAAGLFALAAWMLRAAG